MRFSLSLIFLAALAIFMAPNFLRPAWDGAQPARAAETGSGADTAEQPRLVAAMFRSSWCGACRILEPRVDDVREELAGEPIDWVRFNFTWGQRDGLRDLAVEEGIADIYDQFAGGTGFLVFIDRETGEVLEMVTMRYDRDEIRDAAQRWLSVTRHLDNTDT